MLSLLVPPHVWRARAILIKHTSDYYFAHIEEKFTPIKSPRKHRTMKKQGGLRQIGL